jgi:hypothetical protein
MGFPQLGNIDSRLYSTMKQKAGNNLKATQTMPWIRVISCLNNFLSIESSKEAESFAQKYGNTGKSGRLGLEYPTSSQPKSLYSNPHTDRGLRPSPSIDSISISQGNEGLSKKSSFTIICYSLGQCERIMEYFLEPGHMVLVEWGENTSKSTNEKTIVEKCAIAKYNNLNHIQKKRKSSGGTYDAVLGVITGGGMSYGSNETYEVQVELTSVGELPAYLQHHKGGSDGVATNDSSKVFAEAEVEEEKLVGKQLFMQMYNDLPAVKRTAETKNLATTQPWVTDSINFINMDKETREHLVEQLKGGGTLFKRGDQAKKSIEIKSDVPLFSENRYIRVALAFTILDSTSNKSAIPQNSLCPGTAITPHTVIWKNTICRGFKNMFTANSDYLYIPNKYAPNFDLAGALSTEAPLSQTLPDLSKSNKISVAGTTPQAYVYHLQEESDGKKQVDDLHPKHYPPNNNEVPGTSYFPNNEPLNWIDQACYDTSYKPITALAGDWGFLRDLYVNFDFFCDTIQKNGLVTKDVYYDLLNGMSSATNLYWNFQIQPRGFAPIYSPGGATDTDGFYKWKKANDIAPESCGQEWSEIVDLSMGGIMSKNTGVGLAKFQSRGTNSPFLSAELNFDIPGAMKSQVIARKLKNAPKNPNPEDKEIVLDGLFSNHIDQVQQVLNDVQQQVDADNKETEKIEAITEKEKDDSKWFGTKGSMKSMWKAGTELFTGTAEDNAQDEQNKSNYEFFASTALVVPWLQDRTDERDIVTNYTDSGKSSTISEVAKVAGWNDPSVLKKIQMLNEGLLVENSPGSQGQSNVPLLPIKFSFTVHGVSGIRVGDTFSIIDLPTKYSNKTFQVTQVAHDIAQNIWTTKVEGSMRNLEVGDGEPAEYN